MLLSIQWSQPDFSHLKMGIHLALLFGIWKMRSSMFVAFGRAPDDVKSPVNPPARMR